MRWTDLKSGRLWAPLALSALTAFGVTVGCGGSTTAPTAPTAASAPPAPVASTPPPAPVPEPTASSAPVAPPAEAPQPEDEEAGAELVVYHRHHHHGGITRFIAMSLDTLGVTPEQKTTIEHIQSTLQAKLEPARVAEKQVVTLLADAVATGKVDKGKIDVAVARVGTTTTGVHAAVADALNQLHATLNDAERAALVDKLQAHWQVWQEANESTGNAGEPHPHGRLESLAERLSLTPDQLDKIRTALKAESNEPKKGGLDREKVAAYLKSFGDAFASPTFDAKKLTGGDAVNAQLGTFGTGRMARFYEAVVPVLTPDQRSKLAEHLRNHDEHKEPPTTG